MPVITIPATMFATAEVDPRDTSTPKKMDSPWKAGLLEPGR